MLTADLVRASVRRGKVRPRFVDPQDARLRAEATALVRLFEEHLGDKRGALEEAIADHIGDATDFAVRRGLVKLLMDRSTVETRAPVPPPEVREVVFEEAARAWPVGDDGQGTMTPRPDVLARAAERLDLSPAEVEEALYADLEAEERLVEADLPDPEALLHRYNMNLAQGVLLKAREVVVEIPDPRPARMRQLMRIVKFHRLMHRAEKTGDGWRLVLDGPLSLFQQTQRYGLALALFLPALCHCEAWRLSAEVTWGDDRRHCTLELDQDSGLVTHTRDLGTWESDEERHFRATWKKLDPEWRLRRSTEVLDLDGRGVLVPDYVLRHPDGRKAYLELVWFWRRRTFERRLDLLREAGPPNLIVALATRLNAGEGDLPDLEGGAVYGFKGVIQPKRIVALAEDVGLPAPTI
ncbi:MAG: DUF790 family protein [Myxococcota bacterium]